MKLFNLHVIENYADFLNTMFYVQTEKLIFLPNNLIFNKVFET